MNDISIANLAELTMSLARGQNNQERFANLLDSVRKTIPSDAVALLSLQGNTLTPVAMHGLTQDTFGRRFVIDEHPRLKAICESGNATCFSSNSTLPDPFDGLLMEHDGDMPIHSCMGLPLVFSDKLLGVLTLDSLTPGLYESIPRQTLSTLAAIAASVLKMGLSFNQLERQALHTQQKLTELNDEAWERDNQEMLGNSDAMKKLKSDIDVVAPSNFNILIQGETGVGKELVARALHLKSARQSQPLIYVNCAALPENLVESELFGHVKGAFTGADKTRLGKFALADGGTIFLDEIGELPLAAQSKILRALQNNEIQPVGRDQVQTVDVRVLAATNRDLHTEVKQGRFRSDLFHRLSVFPVTVPPLRQRGHDVIILSGYFLEIARKRLGVQQLKFASGLLNRLTNYDWPGNIRELEHLISRAALRAKARSQATDLVSVTEQDFDTLEPLAEQNTLEATPAKTPPPTTIDLTVGIKAATDAFQRDLVISTLSESNNNWAQAARALKTDRANLCRLAKRLGIEVTKQTKLSG